MSDLWQSILSGFIVGLAVIFIVRRFYAKGSTSTHGCGSCGCSHSELHKGPAAKTEQK